MTSCRLNGKLWKTEIAKCEPTKTGIVYQSRIEAKPAFYPALVQAQASNSPETLAQKQQQFS
jgi:hypothetical protein